MKLKAQYRPAELIATLIIRAQPGTQRLDETPITNTTPATLQRTIGDLTTDGIIRPRRTRTGTTQAHQLTTLGLAWWQGRTTLPVPRLINTHWQWWTPTPNDLLEYPSGGHGYDPDHTTPTTLDLTDDPTQDDDELIADLLTQYRRNPPQ